MSSNRLPISVDIHVRVTEEGTLKGIVSDAQRLQAETGANVKVTANLGESSKTASSSIRGLAFDLRLVSSGLTVLKQEFQGINPVVDEAISGFRILSAGFSAGLGTMSFLDRMTERFGKGIFSLSGITKVLGGDFNALSLGAKGLAVTVGIAAGIWAGTWIGEAVTGIKGMRTEIEGLNQDLQRFQYQMLGIQDVTLGYREDQAMLNMIITQTQYAIDQQGFATAQQTVIMESAQSQTKRLNADLAVTSYQMAQIQTQAGLATNQIGRYEIVIGDVERGAKEFMLGGFLPRGGGFVPIGAAQNVPGTQLGGEIRKSGVIEAEAGEVVMQRGQLASMIQHGGGGGSSISVSLTFPGAIFATEADIEEGLARGGRMAGEELRRSMEMDRYPISRR